MDELELWMRAFGGLLLLVLCHAHLSVSKDVVKGRDRLEGVLQEVREAEASVSQTIQEGAAFQEQILADISLIASNGSAIGSEGLRMISIESKIIEEQGLLDDLYARRFELVGRLAHLNRISHLCAFATQARDGMRWIAQCESVASLSIGQTLPAGYNGSSASLALSGLANKELELLYSRCMETAFSQRDILSWIATDPTFRSCRSESNNTSGVEIALQETDGAIQDTIVAIAKLKAELEGELFSAEMRVQQEQTNVEEAEVNLFNQANVQVTQERVDSDLNRLSTMMDVSPSEKAL